MPEPTLAVQKALRARLVATPAVTALVPAGSILDANQRPAPRPSIMLGEDQAIDRPILIDRSGLEIHATLHLWARGPSLQAVKEIAGAVRQAIGLTTPLDLADPDFRCADCRIESVRFMRDRDGETGHGVVTVYCLIEQRWAA